MSLKIRNDNLPLNPGAGPHQTFLGNLLRQIKTQFGNIASVVNGNIGAADDSVEDFTQLPQAADVPGKIFYLTNEPGSGSRFWASDGTLWKPVDRGEGFANANHTTNLTLTAAPQVIVFNTVNDQGAASYAGGLFTLQPGVIWMMTFFPVFSFSGNSGQVRVGWYDFDGAATFGIDADCYPLTENQNNAPSVRSIGFALLGPDVAPARVQARTLVNVNGAAMTGAFSAAEIVPIAPMPLRGVRLFR